MRMLSSILLLSSTMLLGACAGMEQGTRPQPDWVNRMSAQFPASHYLLGRGQAKRRDVATDRARADLAKNIEVQVIEKTRDRAEATRHTRNGAVEEVFDQTVERDIRTTSRQVIRGARVSDVWEDPKTGEVHVLVTLKRLDASRDLREEIMRHDDLTRVAIARARQTDDLLLKIASVQRAVDEQLARTKLQRVLRVVGNGGQGVRPRWKLADLQGELQELQSRLKIRVQSDDGTLASTVAGALGAAGFMTASDEEALYTLQVRFSGGPPSRREGWYWLRGNLELQLVDPAGNVRGTASWPLKVSAQEKSLLKPRLHQLVERTLKDELRGVILGFAQ